MLCHELEVLNPSVTPPFQLDDDNLSETTRLTHRVLDLRRPQMQTNLRAALQGDDGGAQVTSTRTASSTSRRRCSTKSTPEGARDYLVPSRVHAGKFFALPQSPQLFKQMLMVAGFDRYYQIAKCFRDEDLRADRQPEFTQIDIETSFLTEEEIREHHGRHDPHGVQAGARTSSCRSVPGHDLRRSDGALRLGQAGPARRRSNSPS